MNRNDNNPDNGPGRPALISAVCGILFMVSYVLISLWGMFHDKNDDYAKFIRIQYATIVGLPCAAIGSFVLIVFLKQTSKGSLEFEAPGFKFSGASGPVILWAMCFLVISISIKMLWSPN